MFKRLMAVLMLAATSMTANALEITPRVIGGSLVTEVGLVDGFVSVITHINDGEISICGGTLIASNWVLTAAHCVVDTTTGVITNPNSIQIVINDPNGPLDPSPNVDPETGQPIPARGYDVAVAFPHENYNQVTFINDIALIQTVQDVQYFGTMVLNGGSIQEQYNREVYVIGHGRHSDDDALDGHQRLGQAIIIDHRQCRYFQSGQMNSNNQFCFGNPLGIHNACQGDSGGPSFIPINLNGENRMMQFGIVSFGGARCSGGDGVQTNVVGYLGWINQYVPTVVATVPPVNPSPTPTPEPEPEPTPEPVKKKGGGSFGLVLLSTLGVATIRRRSLTISQ